jgi:hypothetical protein
MYVPKRVVLALLAVAAFAGSSVTAATALGEKAHMRHRDRDARSVLKTSLAPSVPTDPPLFGVVPGAARWVLRFGRADLRRDGRLTVVIRGLVIPDPPSAGTPGPVTTVDAALYCDDRPGAVATSPDVPISRDGNATIEARLTLPPTKCLAPGLLIHPNGRSDIYIAASGFGG